MPGRPKGVWVMNVIDDLDTFDEKSTALKWWYTESCSHGRQASAPRFGSGPPTSKPP